MPHLDEGTLHALLDGELELAEVKEIQNHLGSCAACGSRLHDVKEFLTEADRLVADLQTPAGAPKVRREPAPAPQAVPVQPPPAQPAAGGRPWREPVWDAAPELLLPEDPDEVARRRRRTRLFRWAAMIAVVVGVGQFVRSELTSNSLDLGDDRDVVLAPSITPPAVVSPEETIRQDEPVARRSTPSAPSAKDRAPAPKARAEAKVAEEPAPVVVGDQFDTNVIAAAPDTASAEATPQVLAGAGRADTDETARPGPEADAATREAAAAALEELDRERLRSRANAATAALPPPRPEPQATVEPAARTLEQKAQTYLRIGLDEASKQLGRPMHVIEAMSPEFVGLAQGRTVPGADPNRPVVRVVYRDARGRMILLDQQRLRTGQAPGAASGSLRWILGDVMLYLHGEPDNDVLRNLQRRVR
jgi:Putative zinc-finger